MEGKSYIGIDINGRSESQLLNFHKFKADYCRRLHDDMSVPENKFVCEILEINNSQKETEEAHKFYVFLERPYYNQFQHDKYIFIK